MKVEGVGRLNRNMYVVQASGRSMKPRIKDGDWCVFRSNSAGSRQGKIVLVQHHGYYEADNGGAYSIKQYQSTKKYNEDGIWMHESIVLEPLNKDYNPIIVDSDDADSFRVVGELVKVL